jgi:1-deoxy-D-xylulose-5-phosphate synthase
MRILQKLKEESLGFDVVNARFVKPLDEDLLNRIDSKFVITMEDNVLFGGFGSLVNGFMSAQNKTCKVKNFAYRDEFIPQGAIASLQSAYGVDESEVEEYILSILQ